MRLILIASLLASLSVLPESASAYEMRLVRAPDGNLGSTPADMIFAGPVWGDLIVYDLYLDTQGASDIVGFSVGISFSPSLITFRQGLSSSNDDYPLYSPFAGKGSPPTWLEPMDSDTPDLSSIPPPFRQKVNIGFVSNYFLSVPTRATASDLYLATIVFEATGFGDDTIEFGFGNTDDVFWIDQGAGVIDVSSDVTTRVLWAPEPSSALLLGVGLLGLSGLRTRRARR